MTKSYFNPVDTQNIRHGEEFMLIEGWFEREGAEEYITCGVKRHQKKQFRRNRKEYQKLSEHIGFLPVVVVTPEDSALIREGSDERRRFMNAVIAQFDHEYLNDLITYNHILTQRNALLKHLAAKGPAHYADAEVWDMRLIPAGKRIFEKRKQFISELVPVFQKYYSTISYDREQVRMSYQSHLAEGDFGELLRRNFEKDLILQYTTIGIHKDDLLLDLEDHMLRRFGSQGQQKTFLVALKLAESDFIRQWNGQQPLLLLDDIFDKFDDDRVQKIIHLVAVMITLVRYSSPTQTGTGYEPLLTKPEAITVSLRSATRASI
jgi:DNA replication and repair protein RecF